ncbi:MAG: hypothetical protein V2J20_00340 [Wenzhouxiangella sp.]|jgi:hypothetical protein|nr:hypothetical protein [Wenzhouxiangella sp.]
MLRKRTSIALTMIVALSGCATTGLGPNKVREINHQHVTAVERLADEAGVEVIWVNPPTQLRQRTIEYKMTIQPKRDETSRQQQK